MIEKIANWLNTDRPQAYLRSNGAFHLEQAGSTCDVLLSRGACLFYRFKISALKKSDRESALGIKVDMVSPFKHSAFYASWDVQGASVWIYDRDYVASAIEREGLQVRDILPVAISLHPPARTQANRFLVFEDGWEAQVWSAVGYLEESRWWQDKPNSDELTAFFRGSKHTASVEYTVADARELKSDEFFRFKLGRELLKETNLYTAALVLSLLLVSWEAVATGKALWYLADLQAEKDALELDAGVVLDERNRALRDAAYIDSLNTLQPFPSQLQLLDMMLERLPGNVTIKVWNYQQDSLSVTLVGSGFDLTEYAELFESSPRLSAVDVARGANDSELVVTARLHPSE